MTIEETLFFCKSDICRRLMLEGKAINFINVSRIVTHRGVISVILYRLKRYFHSKNNVLLAIVVRLLKYLEFHICHNEIDPRADIGPGLVIGDLGGLGLSHNNIIGKNCTFVGKATPTLGAMEGIDIVNDRITIGDYCVIGHNVRIINPVTIAEGVQIKSNSVLMNSIKTPGALVSGFPAKIIAVLPLNTVKAWSPLLAQLQSRDLC